MRFFRRRHRHRHDDPLVCREFVELVTDYLEGALPDDQRARFEAHLDACDGCSEYMEQIVATRRTLNALPPEPPDAETRERLVAAFRELRS